MALVKIIGFVQKHLCERGTTVAMYDYAVANEEVQGNVSVIFYQRYHPANHPKVVEKFKERFIVVEYSQWSDIENFITDVPLDYLYVIKYGYRDENITTKIPCLVHSVFTWDPHGNYACVSEKLAKKHNCIWLPHIINPLPFDKNGRSEFRKRYGIPKDAYVYGRYGGKDTFSIEYVKESIREDIDSNPNIWFVFVNTDKFVEHPRVLFTPSIIDPVDKGNFVTACDAMIHGRIEGETFGLAVAEFISLGKPVLSCPAVTGEDNEHIHLGKDWVTVYYTKNDFKDKVWKGLQIPLTENPYICFSPEKVMKIFFEVVREPI
jgi:glycosyltransferase involved in cell wall biosynthesis